MSPTLTLTGLDRRVLSALDDYMISARVHVIADRVYRRRIFSGLSEAELDEVRRVLRGAEHFGLATCNRGWWRITDAGRQALNDGSVPA